MISLSKHQRKILRDLTDWYDSKNRTPFVTLGGYAGTGKTTLISYLRQELHKKNSKLKVAFCSYTGKATRVLKANLTKTKALYPQDSVSTIHSLIYSPIEKKGIIVGWERKSDITAELIVVDEASMIDESIWRDILFYKIPIVAVGDHGQLPPIKENFCLMRNPILKLEEIHRQARDNPIIMLSILAREDGVIPPKAYSDTVKKFSIRDLDTKDIVDNLLVGYNPRGTLVLCGYNSTRVGLNNYMRSALEFYSPTPIAGDRVICLRNNHEKRIFNGMQGTLLNIRDNDKRLFTVEIKPDDEDFIYKGKILKEQFGSGRSMNFTKRRPQTLDSDLFDFGYALTVHKAQGSESDRVILFEERFPKMTDETWRRWLYTGITRAKNELYIIGR